MKMHFLVFLAFCGLSFAALPNFYKSEIDNALKFVSRFEQGADETEVNNAARLKSFSWKDCGTANSKVAIKQLSISPDPLSFPGVLNVQTQFNIKQTFGKPLTAAVEIWRKTFGEYIKVPCIDQFGSCSYQSLCAMLEQIQPQCPDPVKKIGIDCACPFKAGAYNLGKTAFNVAADLIPGGDYHVVANVTSAGSEAVCLDIYLEIQ